MSKFSVFLLILIFYSQITSAQSLKDIYEKQIEAERLEKHRKQIQSFKDEANLKSETINDKPIVKPKSLMETYPNYLFKNSTYREVMLQFWNSDQIKPSVKIASDVIENTINNKLAENRNISNLSALSAATMTNLGKVFTKEVEVSRCAPSHQLPENSIYFFINNSEIYYSIIEGSIFELSFISEIRKIEGFNNLTAKINYNNTEFEISKIKNRKIDSRFENPLIFHYSIYGKNKDGKVDQYICNASKFNMSSGLINFKEPGINIPEAYIFPITNTVNLIKNNPSLSKCKTLIRELNRPSRVFIESKDAITYEPRIDRFAKSLLKNLPEPLIITYNLNLSKMGLPIDINILESSGNKVIDHHVIINSINLRCPPVSIDENGIEMSLEALINPDGNFRIQQNPS